MFNRKLGRGFFGLLLVTTFAVLAVILFESPTCLAYEIDTHCYDTYMMARRVGFTHEYAEYFCKGAEWVDQGWSSTPMSFLPITGEMQRRIWHAPSYIFQPKTVTQDGHSTLSITATAEPDHPVASKLLDEGLHEGNWYKIALAFHVAEDSFGHSGFTTLLLHLYSGHNPDRTWLAAVKYKAMTGLLFKMMLAVRQVAPDEALEPWALQARKQPLDPNEYKKLENENWQDMKERIALDYFRDPRFTPTVVDYILRLAKAKGYISASFDVNANLPQPNDYLLSPAEQKAARAKYELKFSDGTPSYVDPYAMTRKDARQVLKEWVYKHRKAELARGVLVTGSIFNMQMLDYYGLQGVREALLKVEQETTNVNARIAAHDQLINPELEMQLIDQTVDFVSDHQIPIVFDEYKHTQFEADDGPRALEMALKLADRRTHIYNRYGVNFEFNANTRTSKVEARMQAKREKKIQALDPSLNLALPTAKPNIPASVPQQVASFTKREQLGMFLVKNGHNLRTLLRDFVDLRLGGKGNYTISKHMRVREYQIPALLQKKIASGEYKQLGPLSKKNLLGVSIASCSDILTGNQAIKSGAVRPWINVQ